MGAIKTFMSAKSGSIYSTLYINVACVPTISIKKKNCIAVENYHWSLFGVENFREQNWLVLINADN